MTTHLPTVESEGLAFHELHRRGRHGVLVGLGGVLALLGTVFLVVPNLVAVVTLVGLAIGGSEDPAARLREITDLDAVTPGVLTYLLVVLGLAVPVSLGAQRVVTGLRPGWLSSVAGRLRWGWLLWCFLPAAAGLVVALVLGSLLPVSGTGGDVELNDWSSTVRDFLLVTVLLTPLQAAGEEYVFRGFLTQVAGAVVPPGRAALVAAVLVPATLFALFHGAQSVPVFVDRFSFGVAAGVLTILTGGLEAAIAAHVLNNWVAFGLAAVAGDMTETLQPSGGGWADVVVSLARMLVFVGLTLALARHRGIRTRTTGGVLAAGERRV
ncbi:lysostaphin resistance A-like protein [Nocardioides sp.]|uniref:CPBP family intramembrane glutamic endopeptidase n=1 Tax=Nocardioides sp. TaxID=35761 RepID=UPI0035174F4B